ncbi:hypothetical protein [Asaccharospora irregularis]|uniref:Uncharacterized protein n=1 Tax=Asaccharospora irregularis DSM 2635 TaxID=1121321 RepID=A0A1M5K8N9_9FIRM|nr:hypothetical protein [Asaccharospora irregularis]SHG49108.1 hypothetical protein SAMN04488530_102168 [Asaccharospora irregularis DSM 2635]
MQNKMMLLVITGALAIVGIIGLNYDNIKNDIKSVVDNGVVGPKQNIAEQSSLGEEDMIKIMEDNGFSNIAEALKNKDYEAMDEFTNNMTDEDYEKLINLKANISDADYQKIVQIMSENGYDSMVSVMASIDLGGSCH